MPYHVFETDLGWFAVRGTAGGIVTQTSIGHPSAAEAEAAVVIPKRKDWNGPPGYDDDMRDWNPALTDALTRFAAGEPVDLSVFLIVKPTRRFAWTVVSELRRVSRGETVSYAELAERAGSPRAARAVGGVMRSNRTPLLVPCHRVVGAGGRLGGFSAPTGVELKKRLLALEAGPGFPHLSRPSHRTEG